MISVCMAAYNGERYIRQQIYSITTQLSDSDELIISDDGSSDGTVGIIQEICNKDRRIKLLHHKRDYRLTNIKHSKSFYLVTSNFENALKEAKGDYIFLSDQDDIWAENKVSKSVEALKNYDLVMTNYAVIDGDGNIVNSRFLSSCPVSTTSLLVNVIKSKFLGCTMAFSKKALKKSLPFPQKLIGHDLWIGCLNYKNMLYIEEPLQLYRRHGKNVSTCAEKSTNSLLYKIEYRIIFLKQILGRYFSS